MGEAQQLQLQVIGQKSESPNKPDHTNLTNRPTFSPMRSYKWRLKISVYVFFVLAGQTVATILGRLYFEKGGTSKWLATLVQPGGFPLILVLYLLSPPKDSPDDLDSPSKLTLAVIYVVFGVFLAANSLLYSFGLLYLPVSTYTLICASQLGFNALFSLLLNAQKFTPYIINSVFILTISSTLLVFQGDDEGSTESNKVSKGKYIIGFICTVGASAGYGLMLSSTQFCFNRILKQDNFKVVLDLIFYPSFVATGVVLVGLFASGEWNGLWKDMEDFELGNISYVMVLIWTAISWQVFSIGCTGLIFEVSSLFSNVISTFGLPIVPVLAVFVFRDKMNGLKVISMVMAIWGFVSYGYQHYVDDYKSKTGLVSLNEEDPEGLKDQILTVNEIIVLEG
ncbi:purine permease 21-like isoform X1 [Mercurialis annua]|uniref:purine permease 21-like isoform X1 n=2 Tax=Mercurialis annua TaxID=3986 RepID=UPI00215EEE02|nr:purine permease 21-like isoform X1 [Mercurialis annua]